MWAVVEIMGHRVRAGLISDVTIGGATLLRVEHPTRTDHTGDEPLCEMYAPAAVFAIRPCSQDDAARLCETYWPGRTVDPPALSPAFADRLDDDDDFDEDAELVP